MGELARIDGGHAVPTPMGSDLITAVMAGINARTARTYMTDYRDFARFLGAPGPREAIDLLLAAGPGEANRLALAYRVDLAGRKLAPGTIARRLVALRSACKAARRVGRIAWGLDVPGPKAEPYRDTRGPGRDGWRSMLAVARAEATTPKGKRDLALVRLLHDLALRRGEAVALDVADVDLDGSTVAVVGKGKAVASRLTLSRQARDAILDWLSVRPIGSPALFVRLDAAGAVPGRLTGEAVRLVVAALGKRSGLARVPRPHGLRHQAITAALDSGRDIREVRKFSRHAKIDTVLVYDDARRDVAGEIAQAIADD